MDLENHCCVISRLTLAKTLYDPLTAVLNLSVLFSVSVLIFVNSPATEYLLVVQELFLKRKYTFYHKKMRQILNNILKGSKYKCVSQ